MGQDDELIKWAGQYRQTALRNYPSPAGRVYTARWRQTIVAVKILLTNSVGLCSEEAMQHALTLSNPVLENLQKVRGFVLLGGGGQDATAGFCGNTPASLNVKW